MDEQMEELIPETEEAGELLQEQPEEPMEQPEEPACALQEQDMQDFVRQYPGLDPRSIPDTVWEAVRRGETLTGAYGRHELSQLRADNARMRRQLDMLSTQSRSRENSLGSMRSAGGGQSADGFLLGFEEA